MLGANLPATSRADGTYDLEGLVAGLYHVSPSLAGFTFNPTSRTVRVGPSASSVNFTAKAIPPPPTRAGGA